MVLQLVLVPKLLATDCARMQLHRLHAHVREVYLEVAMVFKRFPARLTIHRLLLDVHMLDVLAEDVLVAHHLPTGRTRHGGRDAQAFIVLLHVLVQAEPNFERFRTMLTHEPVHVHRTPMILDRVLCEAVKNKNPNKTLLDCSIKAGCVRGLLTIFRTART